MQPLLAAPLQPAVLRPARPADRDEIAQLMVRVIQASIAPEHQADTIANVTTNLDRWCAAPDDGFHCVAESGGALVGVVLVKQFWNLCSLFVAPGCQRQGIGRQLVQAAAAACGPRSPRGALILNAAPDAVAFYRGLGFQPRASGQPLPPGFLPMQLSLGP